MSENDLRRIIQSVSDSVNEGYQKAHKNGMGTYSEHCREKEAEYVAKWKKQRKKGLKEKANAQKPDISGSVINRKNDIERFREKVDNLKHKQKVSMETKNENRTGDTAGKSNSFPSLHTCALRLLQRVPIRNYGGHLYFYNGICYQSASKSDVISLYRDRVDPCISEEKTMSRISQLSDFILTEKDIVVEDIPNNLHVAILENGIYDVEQQQLSPHTPSLIAFSYIKANFVEDEECPNFEAFLEQVTGGDKILTERLWMFLGYTFMLTTEAKSIFIMGMAPDSGKSVLGNFIESLYPKECVSNIALNDLNKNFSLAPLVGAAVNISLDLPSSRLNAEAVSALKMLTGGDVVTINEKYVPRFSYVNRAKFIFATNNAITLAEPDSAFWNRVEYLPFDYSVKKQDQVRNLVEIFQSEKNAIVSKALRKARKLIKRNFEFPSNQRIESQLREWRGIEVPTIDDFVEECCEFDEDYKGELVDKLYFEYEKYCQNIGCVARTRTYFKSYLERVYEIKHIKTRLGTINPQSAFKGIRLRRRLE